MRDATGQLAVNLGGFAAGTTAVGPGLRDGFWLQGCTLGCPGCFNREMLPHARRTVVAVSDIRDYLAGRAGAVDGISLLGGEPTEQPEAALELLRAARELGLSTVLFSGKTYEQLQAWEPGRRLLEHCDLLIDGPFVAALAGPGLYWRGSSNQRMLRLTDRFSELVLRPPAAAGDITIGAAGALANGVGVAELRLT